MFDLSHACVMISPTPLRRRSRVGEVKAFGDKEERGEVKQFICLAPGPASGRKWPHYRYLANGALTLLRRSYGNSSSLRPRTGPSQ